MRINSGRWIALLGVLSIVFPMILATTGCASKSEPDDPNYVKGSDWKKKSPNAPKTKGDE